jgi:histidine triad (HIT) family protein
MSVLRVRRAAEFTQLRAAGWTIASGGRTRRVMGAAAEAASEQADLGAGRVCDDMAALLADVPPAEWFLTDCPACVLVGGPFVLAEAERLAGTHDDLSHYGVPTTVVRPVAGPEPDRAGCGMAATRGGGCVFCGRVAAGEVEMAWPDAVAFTPLRPVTPGHLLVVPRRHVADAAEDPAVTAATMRAAAEVIQSRRAASGLDFSLITSVGPDATQTVWHLHVHVVPRRSGDGLSLPWSGQSSRPAAQVGGAA